MSDDCRPKPVSPNHFAAIQTGRDKEASPLGYRCARPDRTEIWLRHGIQLSSSSPDCSAASLVSPIDNSPANRDHRYSRDPRSSPLAALPCRPRIDRNCAATAHGRKSRALHKLGILGASDLYIAESFQPMNYRSGTAKIYRYAHASFADGEHCKSESKNARDQHLFGSEKPSSLYRNVRNFGPVLELYA